MVGEGGREEGMIFSPLFNEEGKIAGVGEKTASRKEIYGTVPVIGLTFNEAINDFETDRIEAKERAENLGLLSPDCRSHMLDEFLRL